MPSKGSILYINVIVHNVSEAVKTHVTKKLEKAKVIPNSVVAQAAHTASEFHSPKKYVTQAMSEVICKEVPEALQKKGIHSKMEEVFRENTFAVLELRLVYVDPLLLATAWTENGTTCFREALAETGIPWIQSCLECVGDSNRKYFEEEYLPKIVGRQLASMMNELIGENISDKKIDAETKVNKATEQAIYFYPTLQKLRLHQFDEKRASRNPIKKIRTSIGGASHRRSGSLTTLGNLHHRTSSFSSLSKSNLAKIHSNTSLVELGSSSQRSLNSMYSLDAGEDDKTVDTNGTPGSYHSHASGSKSSLWG